MKKTNKTFKRFAAITSASLLAACAVAPVAFNAVAANSVIINNASSDHGEHTYVAYKIFSGVLSEVEGKKVLTELDWTSNIDANTLITALTTDETLKTDFDGITYSATNTKDSAKKVADVIGTYTQDDAKMQKVAILIEDNLSDTATAITEGSTNNTFSNLEDGYYLFKDSSAPEGSSNTVNDGAFSRYILQVTDGTNISITSKSSAPSVEKKVQEDDKYTGTEYGTGYNDVADHTIGDTIGFKLIGTLPSTYDDYSAYYYQFTDTYASTLDTIDANKDDKVDVVVKYYGKDVPLSGDPSGTIASTYYDVVEANNSFTVTFSNLKEISAIDKDTKIVVEYAAKLTSDAVIGLPGQENKVDLTYSNNPYWNGNSESLTTGTTPEDKVIVFTYEVDINKTDGTNPLTGAKFVLKNADDEYAIVNASGQLTGWTTTKPTVNEDGTITDTDGAILPEQSGAKFIVKGLDDNETYVLEEIKAPAGYNLLTDTYNVTLNADTENGQEWTGVAADALSELTLSYKMTNATDDATIVDNEKTNHNYEAFDITNKKGTQLPGTGGIGTTIFYLGGGAMAAIGGIYLISKRRMRKSEE